MCTLAVRAPDGNDGRKEEEKNLHEHDDDDRDAVVNDNNNTHNDNNNTHNHVLRFLGNAPFRTRLRLSFVPSFCPIFVSFFFFFFHSLSPSVFLRAKSEGKVVKIHITHESLHGTQDQMCIFPWATGWQHVLRTSRTPPGRKLHSTTVHAPWSDLSIRMCLKERTNGTPCVSQLI